ncbi:MAG: hypothetical protein AAF995_08135 [Planctomycetota bacterium]
MHSDQPIPSDAPHKAPGDVPAGAEAASTWAALLGAWTDYARAAVALPEEGEGGRFREAVAPIITLHAIAHALGDSARLPADERAAGVDRAAVQIRESAATLHAIWSGEPLPEDVAEVIADAEESLEDARHAAAIWVVASERLVARHPADLIAHLLAEGFEGDLHLPTPGVPLFEGSPAACIALPGGATPREALLAAVHIWLGEDADGPFEGGPAVQAYRQIDFATGAVTRDLVRPMHAEPAPGQPLLVPAILAGEAMRVQLPIRGADRLDPVEVVTEYETEGDELAED